MYPQPFVKVVASGSLYQDTEIWSTSWSMADPDLTNDAEQPGRLDAFSQAIQDWFARPASWISPYAVLDTIKVNLVDTDGRYVSQGDTVEDMLETGIPGGSGGQSVPPQCTACVSLLSDRRRGPGSHGRFYPPIAGAPPQSDGRIQAGISQDMADSARQLILDLEDAAAPVGVGPLGSLKVVNASRVGAGRFDKVTKIRVGRVLDTIQRRRNDLAEDYITVSALPGPLG